MNAIEKMWTYINTHDQGEIDRPELYSMWNAVVDHVATEQAALERKLAAAQRTITAQAERKEEIIKTIVNDTTEYVRDEFYETTKPEIDDLSKFLRCRLDEELNTLNRD